MNDELCACSLLIDMQRQKEKDLPDEFVDTSIYDFGSDFDHDASDDEADGTSNLEVMFVPAVHTFGNNRDLLYS